MSQYLKNRKYNPTILLQDIMTWLFPSQLAERKQIHDTEMAELSKLVPQVSAYHRYTAADLITIYAPNLCLIVIALFSKLFGLLSLV